LEQEEADLKEMLKQLPSLRKDVASILTHISKYDTIIIAKTDEIKRKGKEIEDIVTLGDGALCPQCKQKLTIEHIYTVKNEFNQEKSEVEEEIRGLRQQISDYKRKEEEDQNQIADLEGKGEQLKKLGRKLGKLVEKNEAIETALRKLKEKEKKIHEANELLEQEKYATEERNKLASVLKNFDKLSKDKEIYMNLRQRVSKYENRKIDAEYIANLQEVKRKSKVEDGIRDTKTSIDNLNEQISSETMTLYEKQKLYDRNKQLMHQLIALEEEAEKLEHDLSGRKQEMAGKNAEIKSTETYLKDLEVDVAKKKDYFRKKQIFQQMQNWLDECFVPIIENIEKYVLQSINEEFNQLFQKWFNTLLETGDISVEVDENFTPIITQAGYSLDVNSLSGGEKTSVALAYRLALNTMIRKIADMDISLLILDEPTDGFGKEQLIRLREVLDDLNRAQIIMVSHERDLESFVDRIYRVTKEGNISKLELIQS
jgi:exonuclease SbcC